MHQKKGEFEHRPEANEPPPSQKSPEQEQLEKDIDFQYRTWEEEDRYKSDGFFWDFGRGVYCGDHCSEGETTPGGMAGRLTRIRPIVDKTHDLNEKVEIARDDPNFSTVKDVGEAGSELISELPMNRLPISPNAGKFPKTIKEFIKWLKDMKNNLRKVEDNIDQLEEMQEGSVSFPDSDAGALVIDEYWFQMYVQLPSGQTQWVEKTFWEVIIPSKDSYLPWGIEEGDFIDLDRVRKEKIRNDNLRK